jgi:hypothetical protein
LEAPVIPPVRIKQVVLTDEHVSDSASPHGVVLSPLGFVQHPLLQDDTLHLAIRLEADLGQAQVDEQGRIPAEQIEKWWKAYEENKDKEEKPGWGQLSFQEKLPEIGQLSEELQYLALQGGYLLIALDKKGLEEDDLLERLRRDLSQAALQCIPFVPIFEPYLYNFEQKIIVVAPVPFVSSKFERPSRHFQATGSSASFQEQTYEHGSSNVKLLARKIVSLANAQGGKLLVENASDEPAQTTIHRALKTISPQLEAAILQRQRTEHGLLLLIEPSAQRVYSINGEVLQWDAGRIKSLSVPELYRLFAQRRKMAVLPIVEAPPTISEAFIVWSHFDARDQTGLSYNPRKQALKWAEKFPFQQTLESKFAAQLRLSLDRPVELYDEKEVLGELEIIFKDKALSGLDVTYFDALGKMRQTGLSVEKESKVKIKFKVNLKTIFQYREMLPLRKFEFKGVILDDSRARDIQSK